MSSSCIPEFQKELDRVNMEIDLEREMLEASTKMAISQLLDAASARGETYAGAFGEGFWKGWDMAAECQQAFADVVTEKHAELSQHWAG